MRKHLFEHEAINLAQKILQSTEIFLQKSAAFSAVTFLGLTI